MSMNLKEPGKAMDHVALPILVLIAARCRELGLRESKLMSKMGYTEHRIGKGLKRLQQLRAGEFEKTADFIRRSPAALEVPEAIVREAVASSRALVAQQRETLRRAAFRPHAMIRTEISVPRPIFVAAMTGATRWEHILLDASRGQDSFPSQAMAVLNQRLTMFGGKLPMFGKATGFVINYEFGRSVEFDLSGKPIAAHNSNKTVGEATIGISSRQSLSTIVKL